MSQKKCYITKEEIEKIIKSKPWLSLYRGKFVAFDFITGEMIRWDNTKKEMLNNLKRYYNNIEHFFIYEVPTLGNDSQ